MARSTISPLRTPREGANPTPRIRSVPSRPISPTTTQTFDVPTSTPTRISGRAISFSVFSGAGCGRTERGDSRSGIFRRRRCRSNKGHRGVAFDHQIDAFERAAGLVAMGEELLQTGKLLFEIPVAKRMRALRVVDDLETIAARNVDRADVQQ